MIEVSPQFAHDVLNHTPRATVEVGTVMAVIVIACAALASNRAASPKRPGDPAIGQALPQAPAKSLPELSAKVCAPIGSSSGISSSGLPRISVTDWGVKATSEEAMPVLIVPVSTTVPPIAIGWPI